MEQLSFSFTNSLLLFNLSSGLLDGKALLEGCYYQEVFYQYKARKEKHGEEHHEKSAQGHRKAL